MLLTKLFGRNAKSEFKSEPEADSPPERQEMDFDQFVSLPLFCLLEKRMPFTEWHAEGDEPPRGIGSFFKFWVWAAQFDAFYFLIEDRLGADLAQKAREIHGAKWKPDENNPLALEVLLISDAAAGVRKAIAESGVPGVEFAHMFARSVLTSHPKSPFRGPSHADWLAQQDEEYTSAFTALERYVAHGRCAAFQYFENALNLVSLKV